jgi:hypothetical protein
MRPYVNRMRLKLADLDLDAPGAHPRFENAKKEMRAILDKKRISGADSDEAIKQALEAAANHQLEVLRRNKHDQDRERAEKDLHLLQQHFQNLVRSFEKLPPGSKAKLNAVVAAQDWRNFDSDMFGELIRDSVTAVSQLSPARTAEQVREAICELPSGARNDPVVREVPRATPDTLLLWESISPQTRSAVEAGLRNWQPPARAPTISFFTQFNALLARHRPASAPGRRISVDRSYLEKIVKIWTRLGLRVGVARDGSKLEAVESAFQRFARLALAAVGDDSKISTRQVDNVKKSKARHRRPNKL